MIQELILNNCILYVKPIESMTDIKSGRLVEVNGRIFVLIGGKTYRERKESIWIKRGQNEL